MDVIWLNVFLVSAFVVMNHFRLRNKRRLRVLKFILELRSSNDVMSEIYLQGSCYNLYAMIHSFDSRAECWYNQVEGHVITKVAGIYVDIRGQVSSDGYVPIDTIWAAKEFPRRGVNKSSAMYVRRLKSTYVKNE